MLKIHHHLSTSNIRTRFFVLSQFSTSILVLVKRTKKVLLFCVKNFTVFLHCRVMLSTYRMLLVLLFIKHNTLFQRGIKKNLKKFISSFATGFIYHKLHFISLKTCWWFIVLGQWVKDCNGMKISNLFKKQNMVVQNSWNHRKYAKQN